MIVEVTLHTDVDVLGAFNVKHPSRMLINAKDAVRIKSFDEIKPRAMPKDYKCTVDAFVLAGPGVIDRFSLVGCWSNEPGTVVVDRVVPVEEKEPA